jgi:predicted MFS family arabinose efflux permease
VERGRRGWVTGVKQSGEAVAIVAGGSVLPTAALVLGWRGAILVMGCLVLAALVASTFALEGSRPPGAGSGTGSGAIRPSIYWLSAYSLAMGAAGGSLTAYLPLYAHESGGLSVAASGGIMVAAGVVAAIGRIAWSRWAEARLGVPAPLGPVALWLGGALWGASGLSFGAVGMLAAMSESDDSTTGRASGLMVFGFGVGLTLTPPVFGWLVDRSQDYGPALWFVTALYGLAVVVIAAGRNRFRSA